MGSSSTQVPFSLNMKGYKFKENFMHPNMIMKQTVSSRIPDFRNLLYWTPSLSLAPSGKGKVEFYTSDLIGKYAVVVQGISTDGKSGSQMLTFEVKKPL